MKAHPASSACSAYHRVAASNLREIGDQDFGLRFAEDGGNVNDVVDRLPDFGLSSNGPTRHSLVPSSQARRDAVQSQSEQYCLERLRLPPRDPDHRCSTNVKGC